MARGNKYNEIKLTIAEIIESSKLPELVRICDNGQDIEAGSGCWMYTRLAPNTEMLLQKVQKVKYGHVKILKFYDNDKMEEENGSEYVLKHETYVDEEFLIPLKCRGKVKFGYKPGSRRRYVTVSQVLDEMPRFVKVGCDTHATLASDLNKKVIIPASTNLELVRKFRNPQDGFTYAEFRDGFQCYAFNERDIINFTDVEDSKDYNLFELIRFKLLPKVLLFQGISPEDAIMLDEELNSALLTCLEGPIHLLRIVDIELLVGLVRDTVKRVYRTVLIPKEGWLTTMANKRIFSENGDKELFIARKYGFCSNSDFIEKFMYFMPLDLSLVTWLRNPDYSTGSAGNDMEMYTHLPVLFQDSSDEESNVAAPAISSRTSVVTDFSQNEHKENGPCNKNVQRKIRLFHKIHKELKMLISSKQKQLRKASVNKQDQEPSPKPKDYIHEKPTCKVQMANLGTQNSSNKGHCTSVMETMDEYETFATEEILIRQSFRPKSRSLNDLYLTMDGEQILQRGTDPETTYIYDYPDFQKMHSVYVAGREAEYVAGRVKSRSLPQIPVPIIEDKPHQRETLERPEYITLISEDSEYIFADNQSEQGFFQYTMVEVEQCFKRCGLSDFGSKCLEHRLDGQFFKHFDLQELKKEPFEMSDFQVLKVKKIIFEGWRPIMYK